MGNIESVDGQSDNMKHHIMPLKVPIPDQSELEERFALVLNSMNLPPDKARLLRQYDNDKKWDLICDQERFQVKNPPHTYISKLRGYLDPGVTRKKFRRRVQESTKVLRELEISLRTNHIGWVREFLNDENRGLDILVEYLSFAQCAVMLSFEGLEMGEEISLDKSKSWSRSIEDLHQGSTQPFCNTLVRSARQSVLRYGTAPNSKTIKNSRLVSQKDDVHVCIMCLRAIMNYQYGFNLVMSHAHAVNEIALSLNNRNSRTKALVLELLAAVCLVRGGHEIILSAFDNFKEVCKEKHRFEKLMDYFRVEDGNIDFMVACMQFINIVVHSVEDMNFRVHLQYEFTKLGLDEYLEKSKYTESDKLSVQIQAYLDNVFDVGGLLEDAETKNVALEKVEELEEHLSHVTEKLLDVENETITKVADLEKQLLQKDKDLHVIRETYESTNTQVHTLRRMIKEKDAAFQRSFNIEKRLLEMEQQGTIRLRKQPDGDIAIEPLGGGGGVGGGGGGGGGPVVPLGDFGQNGGFSVGPGGVTGPGGPGGPGTSLPRASEAPPPPPPPPLPSALGENAPCPHPPPPMAPPLPGTAPNFILNMGLSAIRIKKPIKTKFRLPIFNWTALKPNQINGTVFSEIDDERVLEDLDVEKFEELFKTKAQGPVVDLSGPKTKVSQKAINKVSLLDANRSKNLAITLRKANKSTEEICKAIQTFDLKALPVDFVECLMRFLPTEAEGKMMRQYERERRPLDALTDEDRFMLFFSKIERLTQRMNIITFVGNFSDNVNMLTPQLNAIIAASASVKSSPKLKRMLEIILALGNYMNSSKRGSVYGFKLQSLDLLLDTKSTDRKMTLLHYIAVVVKEKYPELANFFNELHFVDKAAAVSLENVLLDVRELGKGMDLIRRESSLHDHSVLKGFLQTSDTQLDKLQKDAKTAEEAFNNVVNYFGESSKTTPPSVFFPVFVRFIRAYKDAVEDNEQRKKQEKAMREKLLAQEAKQHDPKVQVVKKRQQQQELISELRKRQAKDHRPVYEGKDGTIEDIITVLKSVPFTARTAKRGSRFFCDAQLCDDSNC
ncbi:formin-like protein 3 isoform X1 [Salvelinus fontinalis]|uniref:Formin-like protein 3 n=1 Tax=Salvelinus namaycush TaxID=8040 RepID=A0A8U1ESU8_SALNM|nr:formin-like protein 3 [Salvelinus namaycush]XP_055747526.1 formin-like protein 3 isoform X1 [Salvelinus fontinalis]